MEKSFPSLCRQSSVARILEVPPGNPPRRRLTGRERPELLVGGPPCTPFSKSGFWLEWKRAGLDPDASLLQAYTRVLAEARPRAFILENVYALTYNNKASRPAFKRLLREIDAAGYHCQLGVLNAADFGVPQLRPRLFIVGAQRDRRPSCPSRRTGVAGNGGRPGRRTAHVTTGEALDGSGHRARARRGRSRPVGSPPGRHPAG